MALGEIELSLHHNATLNRGLPNLPDILPLSSMKEPCLVVDVEAGNTSARVACVLSDEN